MEHQGQFYIDLCLPMGMKVSTDIWGRIVDLLRLCGKSSLTKEFDKIGCQFVGIRNWVDDIMALAVLDNSKKLAADALLNDLYSDFGLPLSEEKHREWSQIIVFLGLIWNLVDRTVSISVKKAKKGFNRVTSFLELPKFKLGDLEPVTGYLSYLSFVMEEGRFHLVSLFALQASFEGDKFRVKSLSNLARADLRWWQQRLDTLPLSTPDDSLDSETLPVVTRSLLPLPSTFSTILKSDASDTHLAFALDDKHAIYALKPNWRSTGHNIDFPEVVALELALLALFDMNPRLSNSLILAYVDNEGVVKSWNARRCRGERVNASLLRIYSVLERHSCQLEVEWIASEDNETDDLTRGVEPRAGTKWYEPSWNYERPSKSLLEIVDFPKAQRLRLK